MIPDADRDRLHDYIDDRLAAAERVSFERELEERAALRRAHEEFLALRRGLAELRNDSAPGDLRTSVLKQLALDRAGLQSRIRRGWRRPWVVALAAAALAVATIGLLRDTLFRRQAPSSLADRDTSMLPADSEPASGSSAVPGDSRTESKHDSEPVPTQEPGTVSGGLAERGGAEEKKTGSTAEGTKSEKPAGLDRTDPVVPAPAAEPARDAQPGSTDSGASTPGAEETAGQLLRDAEGADDKARRAAAERTDGELAKADSTRAEPVAVRVVRLRRPQGAVTSADLALLLKAGEKRKAGVPSQPSKSGDDRSWIDSKHADESPRTAALAAALAKHREQNASAVIERIEDATFLEGLLERARLAGVEVAELTEVGTPKTSSDAGPTTGGGGSTAAGPATGGGTGFLAGKAQKETGPGAPAASAGPAKASPATRGTPSPSLLSPLRGLSEKEWRWAPLTPHAALLGAKKGAQRSDSMAKADPPPAAVRYILVIVTEH